MTPIDDEAACRVALAMLKALTAEGMTILYLGPLALAIAVAMARAQGLSDETFMEMARACMGDPRPRGDVLWS